MVHAQDAHIGATASVVCHHAISQIGMILCHFKVEGQGLPYRLDPAHFHKPELIHRGSVLKRIGILSLEQVIA